MLDFTKKRTMPLVLGDGTHLELKTPSAAQYFALSKMGGSIDDFLAACGIILNLNTQGIVFTKDEINAGLSVDELMILTYAYLDFVADIKNDPNFTSRPAQTTARTGSSTITP